MEEKLGKLFGPEFFIIVQMVIILVSFGNLTEFFFTYEQHSVLNSIFVGTIRLSYIGAGGEALGIDAITLAFSIAAVKAYNLTHEAKHLVIPILGLIFASTVSAIGNYIVVASSHAPEFSSIMFWGFSATVIGPIIIASMPYWNVALTFAIPALFPKTKALSAEEQRATILQINQDAEIKEARARANAKINAARLGGITEVAKSTGVGKRLAEKMGLDDGPQTPDETPEDQIGMAILELPTEPEWVGTSDLAKIYNRHIGSGKAKVDDRKIRAWADAGKIPGEKADDRWRFDLNVLAQHTTFRTIVARHRRAEEKKRMGGKAGPSRPATQPEWGDSGPLASIPLNIARQMEQTPPVADR